MSIIPEDMKFGSIHSNKSGYLFTIMDYKKSRSVLIQFIDTRYQMIVRSECIRSGSVEDPFSPTLAGAGYIGIGKHSSKNNPFAYECWSGMLKRVYSKSSLNKRPNYESVSVCSEWLCFQTFADWCDSNKKEDGWHLDKDILSGSIKIYSPASCSFIPSQINNFLVLGYSYKNRELPTGVTKVGNSYKYVCTYKNKKVSKNFSSIKNAVDFYKEIKCKQAEYLLGIYKEKLDPRVSKVLENFKDYLDNIYKEI